MAKSTFARIEDRVEEAVLDLRRTAEEAAEDTQHALTSAAGSLARASQRLLADARARGGAAGRMTVREVREHPLATTAILLSVAVVAGALLARSLRD